MFADFHTGLKRKLAAVHGTYVTTKRRLPLQLILPDGARRVTSPSSTRCCSPLRRANSPTSAIIGTAKNRNYGRLLDRGDGEFSRGAARSIRRVCDQGRRDCGTLAVSIFNLFAELGISGIKVTLGSAGVAMFKTCSQTKRSGEAFSVTTRIIWGRGRPLPTTALLCGFAASAYHGGLNSIYHVGYSPIGRDVFDIDLSGAYTTALAAMGWPTGTAPGRRRCRPGCH